MVYFNILVKILKRFKIFSKVINNKIYYTVKEVTANLKDLLERNFSHIWIEGEISNLKQSQTGHIYFNLVEEEASLKCVIFKNHLSEETKTFLKNGIKVLAFGTLSFYGRSGECSFIVKRLSPIGKGLIMLKKEILIKKYAALFARERKKAIPLYPRKVAVITSLFGAALKDFLKVGLSRWKTHILVYPVRVQGEGAEKEIVRAIRDINLYFQDVEVIVITRGGGSIEDLAPFYTEDIILGIKDSKIPVVSAVGHEIDVTLCDLIADKRCPTPTAAAQEVFPDASLVKERLEALSKKLVKLVSLKISEKEGRLFEYKLNLEQNSPYKKLQKLETLLKKLNYQLQMAIKDRLLFEEKNLRKLKEKLNSCSPEAKLKSILQKIEFWKEKLGYTLQKKLELERKRLIHLKTLLFSLSPLNVLERGYSIVRNVRTGAIVKASKEVSPGEKLEILLARGRLLVKVLEVKNGDKA